MAVVSACQTATPAPQTFTLAATDLTAELAADLVAAYRQNNAAPLINVVPQSALAGELAARNAQAAFTTNAPQGFYSTPIAYVSFVVVVHPNNPVNTLTLAQVQATYGGQLTDWAQVGGSAGAVQVLAREDGSDGAGAFNGAALNGIAITPNAQVAATWVAMRQLIQQNPNAVGYLPASEVDATVKALTLDSELRVLIVAVAPAEPTGAPRDFLAWAQSEAGQAAAQQNFFALP
ncbi:MAG: substrate-binding domain-containing protein [Anaerolineales bacterium]|nr:substrate-binding domain-containing protein [Anaerolineales bacterium]